MHAELIDGTGSAPRADQTIVLDHARITMVSPSASAQVPPNAKVINATDKTVIPGLVGMHEHLFYALPGEGEIVFAEQPFSFPQLYLASGVTTARTTGSIEPYADLAVKARVDSGLLPGPEFYLTTPYLQGAPSWYLQMHELKNADEALQFVRYWHSVGFTSVKAYANITPDELRAGIEEAHKLGMKITGHLCSVGFRQAAEMGIDNLEHGPYGAPDGELFSKKEPGICPSDVLAMLKEIATKVEPGGPQLTKTIRILVAHHVAITSTLPILEFGERPPISSEGLVGRAHRLMSPQWWSRAMTDRARWSEPSRTWAQMLLKKEMRFEREFVAAGGFLMAGSDPAGGGLDIAGLGDEREVELLAEAGFTTPEAIHIATQNGAAFLGIADRVGTIAVGKQADLVLLDGDLANHITTIEKPEIVFEDGVRYSSKAIYDSLREQIGLH
jgi:imidazolonepropionase-like amidohydrolase